MIPCTCACVRAHERKLNGDVSWTSAPNLSGNICRSLATVKIRIFSIAQPASTGRNPIVYCRISCDVSPDAVQIYLPRASVFARRPPVFHNEPVMSLPSKNSRIWFIASPHASGAYAEFISYTMCPEISLKNILGTGRYYRACYLFVTTCIPFPLFVFFLYKPSVLEVTCVFVIQHLTSRFICSPTLNLYCSLIDRSIISHAHYRANC